MRRGNILSVRGAERARFIGVSREWREDKADRDPKGQQDVSLG
jgi:hypothetical protein